MNKQVEELMKAVRAMLKYYGDVVANTEPKLIRLREAMDDVKRAESGTPEPWQKKMSSLVALSFFSAVPLGDSNITSGTFIEGMTPDEVREFMQWPHEPEPPTVEAPVCEHCKRVLSKWDRDKFKPWTLWKWKNASYRVAADGTLEFWRYFYDNSAWCKSFRCASWARDNLTPRELKDFDDPPPCPFHTGQKVCHKDRPEVVQTVAYCVWVSKPAEGRVPYWCVWCEDGSRGPVSYYMPYVKPAFTVNDFVRVKKNADAHPRLLGKPVKIYRDIDMEENYMIIERVNGHECCCFIRASDLIPYEPKAGEDVVLVLKDKQEWRVTYVCCDTFEIKGDRAVMIYDAAIDRIEPDWGKDNAADR